ncbi:MAG TPA: mercury methylation corrinoid protein HgcA [Victivallales bacterium]|nr:mercury methylation corrinoid protein HgcA [Victivallales bacterium]
MSLENKHSTCCSSSASSCCDTSSAKQEVSFLSTYLNWKDRVGHWKVRCSFSRMNYKVEPGLYGVGKPSKDSPVLVSANYKLSVDRLRTQLTGRDVWILVLDTKGVNVWCAAGKGTFGTDELISRIEESGLSEHVSHKNLIVPQLGATGVSAHQVKKRCGYNVKFGPVRAEDLPEYMDNKMTASEKMRKVDFPMIERAVLIPADFVLTGRNVIIAAIILALIGGFANGTYSFYSILTTGLIYALMLIITFAAASAFGPLLLPWLPGRAFAVKGVWIGIVCFIFIILFGYDYGMPNLLNYWFNFAAWLLICSSLSSFVVMNFTGASTYTSLSGVLKEMSYAVPIQIVAGIIGVILLIAGRFI